MYKKPYKNPIILCDYSDPDVIFVDGIYYLTASSFNFMPGLPVLASYNLVDWQLVNYAVKEIPGGEYEFPRNAGGIWAPSFSYHNGKFYIIVGIPDDGIFITETENPFGEWSALKKIWSGKGFIDPSLIWNVEGKSYIVHAYAKSRCGFNSKLGILEFDEEKFACTGEDKIIFDGTKTQPTIEGPKIYKIGEYFYIFAPAGGVSNGWQTVLRSKNIFGPYEEKIVLQQGKTSVNGPHQGALTSDSSGKNWFIHFQDRGIFGRITHLQPVEWENDWPVLGNNGEPFIEFESPAFEEKRNFEIQKNALRAFKNASLEWQWAACGFENFAEQEEKISAGENCGKRERFILNVVSKANKFSDGVPVLWNSSNILTQKIKSEKFDFRCSMNVAELEKNDRAGIIFQGQEYATVAVEKTESGFDFVYINSSESKNSNDAERTEREIKRFHINESQTGFTESREFTVEFKMEFKAQPPQLDKEKNSTPEGSVKFIAKHKNTVFETDTFTTKNAHWVGGRYGVYAIASEKNTRTEKKVQVEVE